MALNLKIAELYADLIVKDQQFFAKIATVKKALAGVKLEPIAITFNLAGAKASLNLLLQQLRAVTAQAQALNRATGGGLRHGGRSGAGGGGGGAGPNLQAIEDRYTMRDYRARVRAEASQQRAAAAAMASQQRAAAAAMASQQRAAAAAHQTAMAGGPDIGRLGMLAGGAAVLGVGAVVKASITTAVDLEAKLADVQRVAGLSADNTGRLKRELIAISMIQPGATLDDLITMANIGGRMGLQGDQLKEFASGLAMVKNSVAGMETEDLANKMARVMHVFQLDPAKHIKGMGSALTGLDNATTATAADILNITQRLSGTAAAIGMTLPQVMALSATLRDVGLSPEVAGTAFSQIFTKMGTDSAKFAKAAGVDAKEFADAYRKGPMEALTMLMKGLGAAGGSIEKLELLKELGLTGARVQGSLLQVGQAFDQIAKRAKEANDEFTSLNALMAADALKGDTTAAALTKMQNAATGLADAIGGSLLPFVRNAADGFTAWAQAIDAARTGMEGPVQMGPGGGVMPTMGGMMNFGMGMMGHIADPTGMARQIQLTKTALGTAVTQAGAGPKGPALPVPAVGGVPDTANAATAHKAGEEFFAALKGRIGTAGVVAGVFGGAIRQDLRQAADALHREKPEARVGMTGAEVGRQRQADILSNRTAEEQLRETRTLGVILGEIRGLLSKGQGQVTAAVLGP